MTEMNKHQHTTRGIKHNPILSFLNYSSNKVVRLFWQCGET